MSKIKISCMPPDLETWQTVMEEMVEWKDIDGFIEWWESDKHDFDIYYDVYNEPIGYINVKTGKSYIRRELFDYYIKYVKK